MPPGFTGLLLDKVGKRHHGRQGKRAVANKVGRNVELHPPAFQGGHQGLNFVRFTHHGVPEQKPHCGADHQHDKRAHGSGVVLSLKIQVKRGRQPAEQHEHLVQVADGDVPDVCANQVTLVPAHHRASQRHGDGHPGHPRADHLHSGAFHLGKHAQPIKNGAHEKQHAHPQDSRLAGQKVLEPKYGFSSG